jgi:hypothetical protein
MIPCVACSTTLLHHCTAVGCFIAAYEATNIPRHLTIGGWEARWLSHHVCMCVQSVLLLCSVKRRGCTVTLTRHLCACRMSQHHCYFCSPQHPTPPDASLAVCFVMTGGGIRSPHRHTHANLHGCKVSTHMA